MREWGAAAAVTKLCRWHANAPRSGMPADARARAPSQSVLLGFDRRARSFSGNKFIRCMKKTQ